MGKQNLKFAVKFDDVIIDNKTLPVISIRWFSVNKKIHLLFIFSNLFKKP